MHSAFAAWRYSNSRRAASPLVKFVEKEDRWEVPDHPRVFSLKIVVEPSQITASCMMLKDTANDKCICRPLPRWASI
ncbi:hypothetical protein TNCV_3535001 [Trichonephila clavipes]|nr:hypothetical protein TNCV_3535001 [Trichonephila clavipes]